MPPKRGKSGKKSSLGEQWDAGLVTASVSSAADEWEPYVFLLHAQVPEAADFVDYTAKGIAARTRRRFACISQPELLAWTKEQAKAKTKPKDGMAALAAEICTTTQTMLESGEEVQGDMLARLIKAEQAMLEAQKPSSAASGRNTPKTPKSRSGNKSKGKGGAVDADLPGKKKSTLKKRGEEDGVPPIDDEPSSGPDYYLALHGFTSPAVAQSLSAIDVAVGAVLSLTHPADPPAADEPKDKDSKDKDGAAAAGDAAAAAGQQFLAELRALQKASPTGSHLRNLAVVTLETDAWEREAAAVFDAVAFRIYSLLAQRDQHADYLQSLQAVHIPTLARGVEVERSTYNSLLDRLPPALVTPAVVLSALLAQVEVSVAASAEAAASADAAAEDADAASAAAAAAAGDAGGVAERKGSSSVLGKSSAAAPTSSTPQSTHGASGSFLSSAPSSSSSSSSSSPMAAFLDALLEPLTASSRTSNASLPDPARPADQAAPSPDLELAAGEDAASDDLLVVRSGDLSASLMASTPSHPQAIRQALAAARQVEAASLGAAIVASLHDNEALPPSERAARHQQLLAFSRLPRSQLDRALVQIEFENMLSGPTAPSCDLTDWNVSEEFSASTLSQVLTHAATAEGRQLATRYYSPLHVLLVCLFRAPAAQPSRRRLWHEQLPTPVGFANYLDHVAPLAAAARAASSPPAADTTSADANDTGTFDQFPAAPACDAAQVPAYDVGDLVAHAQGSERTLYTSDGVWVRLSQQAFVDSPELLSRTVGHASHRFTLTCAPAAGGDRPQPHAFVAAFSDGAMITLDEQALLRLLQEEFAPATAVEGAEGADGEAAEGGPAAAAAAPTPTPAPPASAKGSKNVKIKDPAAGAAAASTPAAGDAGAAEPEAPPPAPAPLTNAEKFQPVLTTPDGTVAVFLPNGCVRLFPAAAAATATGSGSAALELTSAAVLAELTGVAGAPACEVFRSITPSGAVVRHFSNRTAQVLFSNGATATRSRDGDWLMHALTGEVVYQSTAADTSAASAEQFAAANAPNPSTSTNTSKALRTEHHTDVDTQDRVLLREDLLMQVQRSDGLTVVEARDGTRITTAADGSLRVEALGLPAAVVQPDGNTISLLLGSGACVVHRAAAGTLSFQPASGGELKLSADSLEAAYQPEEFGSTCYAFGLTDLAFSGHDSRRRLYRIAPDGTVSACGGETEAGAGGSTSAAAVSDDHFAPRLFVVREDGSGLEMLRESNCREYIHSMQEAEDSQVSEQTFADADEGVAWTIMQPMPLMDAAALSYSQPLLLPPGLQRRPPPSTQLQQQASRTRVLFCRQLVCHPKLDASRRQQLAEDLGAYRQFQQEQEDNYVERQIHDQRPPSEQARAQALLALVPPTPAKNVINRSDSQLAGVFLEQDSDRPAAGSPRKSGAGFAVPHGEENDIGDDVGVDDDAERSADAYFHNTPLAGTLKEIKAQLAANYIPDFRESEEGRAILRRARDWETEQQQQQAAAAAATEAEAHHEQMAASLRSTAERMVIHAVQQATSEVSASAERQDGEEEDGDGDVEVEVVEPAAGRGKAGEEEDGPPRTATIESRLNPNIPLPPIASSRGLLSGGAASTRGSTPLEIERIGNSEVMYIPERHSRGSQDMVLPTALNPKEPIPPIGRPASGGGGSAGSTGSADGRLNSSLRLSHPSSSRPNEKRLAVEEPIRRTLRTASTSQGTLTTIERRGFALLPERLDFGVLKDGSVYSGSVRLRNLGVDSCRFRVTQPAIPELKATARSPGAVAAGMDARVDIQLTASASQGPDFAANVQFTSETQIFYLAVTATVLGAAEFEHRRATGGDVARAAGIKLVRAAGATPTSSR